MIHKSVQQGSFLRVSRRDHTAESRESSYGSERACGGKYVCPGADGSQVHQGNDRHVAVYQEGIRGNLLRNQETYSAGRNVCRGERYGDRPESGTL